MSIEALPATAAAASEETREYRFKSNRGARRAATSGWCSSSSGAWPRSTGWS